MRCTNCGFENAEDATHCIKCKTALDSRAAKQASRPPKTATPPVPKKETAYAGTILDSQVANLPKQEEPLPSTQTQATAIETKSALTQCPHPDCGYPYSSEQKVCPRCQRAPGKPAASAAPSTNIQTPNTDPVTTTPAPTAGPTNTPGLTVTPNTTTPDTNTPNTTTQDTDTPTPNITPTATSKPFAGTIDPYRTKTIIDTPAPPICYLQPIPKQDETGPPQKLSFTGPSAIDLNRDNLDPGNPSITGKIQAELTFEDGAWQLKDKSELQTTFILASAQTPLKDGDIILVGDRKFIFSISPAPDK